MSLMSRRQNEVKLSALSLDADSTMNLSCGSIRRLQTTKAAVIQLLPTPRKASVTLRRGPYWSQRAMSSWTGVGSGRPR